MKTTPLESLKTRGKSSVFAEGPAPAVPGLVPVEIDVRGLMEHVQQILSSAACDGETHSLLWTNLDIHWDRIHFYLENAARDGRIEGVLSGHLPAYPLLTKVGRLLGLRALRNFVLFPCKLVLRLMRPQIFKAARRQERVNQSLVNCSRGLALRLAECESQLRMRRQDIEGLENSLQAQIQAQAARIRFLEDQLARASAFPFLYLTQVEGFVPRTTRSV